MNEKIQDSKVAMEKAIEHLRSEFSKLRVGRATTGMVDSVKVDVYGSAMMIKEVASVSIPDAKTITIQPWDRTVMPEIERGILAANLGLTPMNDGTVIRINLPILTEERRKDFVKQIKKFGEDAKVSIRNVRRDTIDGIKALKDQPEDVTRRFQEDVQKLTDQFSGEVDKLVDSKSKELLTL